MTALSLCAHLVTTTVHMLRSGIKRAQSRAQWFVLPYEISGRPCPVN